MQALAGCYAVTYAANAAARGVELSSLRLDMEVDFDLRGFLGLDKSVRPGAQEIRVTVHAESPNTSLDGLEELTEAVSSARRSVTRSPTRCASPPFWPNHESAAHDPPPAAVHGSGRAPNRRLPADGRGR
ncbi:OsmC family protein [Streptomyces malaysiensis]|uniref:OsmC family protein n=1 Tax=Streptomyces malaysiensis TaxID=92644 RepID=UPI001AD92653